VATAPAHADYAIVKFKSGYCRIYDNTAWAPPDGTFVWFVWGYHRYYRLPTLGVAQHKHITQPFLLRYLPCRREKRGNLWGFPREHYGVRLTTAKFLYRETVALAGAKSQMQPLHSERRYFRRIAWRESIDGG
jgi:hypothetical protein